MKTDRLFYDDVYQKEFEGTVLHCEEKEGRYYLILDRTIFYPEGGGQPADRGTLNGIPVTDVQYEGEELCHILSSPIPEGTRVLGKIDWERRFDLMQQHSGEHIVSGMIHETYGWENVGFHMGEDRITIDFSGVVTSQQAAEIENRVNTYLWQNQKTHIFYPEEQERAHLPYRSKKELNGEVRLVEFPGADLCACCGLHVTYTGEIGLVKIISCKKFREGVRMEMLSGRRALEYLAENTQQNSQIAVDLSVKETETGEAVRRLLSEIYELKGERNQILQEVFALKAQECEGRGDVLLFLEDMEAAEVRKCADAVLHVCGGTAAVLSGDEQNGYKYAIGKKDGNIREFVVDMNRTLHGRGGGKPFFAQGSLKASRAEIQIFFQNEGFFFQGKNG